MEFFGITEALSSLVTTSKRLLEVAKNIRDAETKNLIADLNLHIADFKMKVVALQEENAQLKAQLRQRDDVAELRENLEIRQQVYYFRTPIAGRADGPYCPRCFDTQNQLVLVTAFSGPFTVVGKFNCPNCKAVY